ncbi:hypothetical protein CDAR_90751 [Caerostris darwini]|uniref:Metallothionein n=1 Tax=Caerostris darwini TaxID=1538125 RepID=A0AAV4RNR1_9ARAC|nr:hypothetical protein CDAR_90751 [Caerostris darwini]
MSFCEQGFATHVWREDLLSIFFHVRLYLLTTIFNMPCGTCGPSCSCDKCRCCGAAASASAKCSANCKCDDCRCCGRSGANCRCGDCKCCSAAKC